MSQKSNSATSIPDATATVNGNKKEWIISTPPLCRTESEDDILLYRRIANTETVSEKNSI
nr:hypothetical protein [Enterococcus plantarum]